MRDEMPRPARADERAPMSILGSTTSPLWRLECGDDLRDPARPQYRAVSDWGVSNGFYRDVVGAELVDAGDGRTAYRLHGTQLNVHGPGVEVSDNVARLPVRPGNGDLCFVWPGSLEEAVAHLAQHNVEIETGAVERRRPGSPA